MDERKIQSWVEKVKSNRQLEADLSKEEDLSIALMNLVSLEEHFYFSAMKTGKSKYLEMLNSTREIRKRLLKKIVTAPEGEEWCISKHLLAASMRLIEVGTKELGAGNKEEAATLFTDAFGLYSLFIAINNKLIKSEELIKETASAATIDEAYESNNPKNNVMTRVSAIVKKLIDCCKE